MPGLSEKLPLRCVRFGFLKIGVGGARRSLAGRNAVTAMNLLPPRALARAPAGAVTSSVPALRARVAGIVLLTSGMCVGMLAADRRAEPASRNARAPSTAPWFDSIEMPVALSQTAGTQLCKAIHAGLNGDGRSPDSADSMPSQAGARIVFITAGTHSQRGPVIGVGSGRNLADAVSDAYDKTRAAWAGRGDMRWLKLDIVQHVYRTDSFVIGQSPVPLPSLTGIAFGAAAGFAFLPEQLIAWDFVSPDRRLYKHRIGQSLAAEEKWQDVGKWGGISSFANTQSVYFFECQSFFSDGAKAEPLFRGHRLFRDLTAADLLERARAAGTFLTKWCSQDGAFTFQWQAEATGFTLNRPVWQTGPDEKIPLRDHAEAALALARLKKAADTPEFLHASRRTLEHILTFLRPYGNDARAGCLVEGFRSTLEANAMTVLALLEYREAAGSFEYREALAKLALYILRQLQPDGTFVCERTYPADNISSVVSLPVSSLAAVALVRLYETTGRPAFLAGAQKALAILLKTYVEGRAMDRLPRDEWLLLALDQCFTYGRDEALTQAVEKIALAIETDQTRAADFPDLVGSVNNSPSATIVAGRTRALAVAARLLRDTGRDKAAEKLIADTHLNLVFQLQAQMDEPVALYFATPADYLGAFRDHVMAFGFALHCQSQQILSLLAVWEQLQEQTGGEFPVNEHAADAFAAQQARLSTFPRYLPRDSRAAEDRSRLLIRDGARDD